MGSWEICDMGQLFGGLSFTKVIVISVFHAVTVSVLLSLTVNACALAVQRISQQFCKLND